jgi:hypothetical protein
MRDELVTEEIEIDPLGGGTAFRTAEARAIERARGGEVVDGDGEMEGGQHGDLDDATGDATGCALSA